jgi:RsiW-degrading membrane proteinase PrsW (M82 family)
VILCPNCGNELDRGEFCATCGEPTGEGNYCRFCGTPYAGPNFCPSCGFELTGAPVQQGPPPRLDLSAEMAGRRSGGSWRRWVAGCGCLPGTLIVVLILISAAEGNLGTLAVASLAAIIPTVFYVWFVLSLDRYEKEPMRAVAFAFGWGAVGAVLFSVFAELFFAGFAIVAAGEEAASTWTLVVGAPVIEEAFKGLALLLLLWFYRHELDSVLDGLIYGAIVGLGFAMTENIGYFIFAYEEEGVSGLGELFIVRAVINGFGHAMYTGIIGAAIGWSRNRYSRGAARIVVPLLGYMVGVVLHMLWNGGVLAIGELQGEDATVWSVMLVEVPLFVIPPLIILYMIARRGSETELGVMKAQLADEVGYGVLTPAEYDEVTSHQQRKARMRQARKRGWRTWRTQRHFYMAAGDLAFRKHHLAQGASQHPEDRGAIFRSRAEIARTRELLGRDTMRVARER